MLYEKNTETNYHIVVLFIFNKSAASNIDSGTDQRTYLHPSDKTCFAPTTEWDAKRSHDRIFS